MESRLLIGGELVAGEGPELSVENPFTETTLAAVRAPVAGPARCRAGHRDRGLPHLGRDARR